MRIPAGSSRLAAAAPRRRRRAPRRPADRRPRRPDAARRARGRGLRDVARRRRARVARRRAPRRPAAPPRRAREALARGPRRPRRRHDRAAARAAARPRRQRQGPGRRLGRARLAPHGRFAVDCGGDVRLGGTHEVAVRGTRETIAVTDGAVATSGLDRRVWQRPDGSYAHHLLDPSTGAPAWTGLIAATACAADRARSGGAREGRAPVRPAGPQVLAAGGGILVHDSGDVERIRPPRCGWPRDPRPDGLRLVAGVARVGPRRARAHHPLGRRRPRDGGPRIPEARARQEADGAARARRAGRVDRDRGARHHAARRLVAAPRARSASRCRSRWTTSPPSRASGSSAGTSPPRSGSRSTRAAASGRSCGASCTARRSSSTSSRSSTRWAAGTDASEPWLRIAMAVTGAPILYLLVVRMLPAPQRPRPTRRRTGTSAMPGAS